MDALTRTLHGLLACLRSPRAPSPPALPTRPWPCMYMAYVGSNPSSGPDRRDREAAGRDSEWALPAARVSSAQALRLFIRPRLSCKPTAAVPVTARPMPSTVSSTPPPRLALLGTGGPLTKTVACEVAGLRPSWSRPPSLPFHAHARCIHPSIPRYVSRHTWVPKPVGTVPK